MNPTNLPFKLTLGLAKRFLFSASAMNFDYGGSTNFEQAHLENAQLSTRKSPY
ncbi:MAG: hypothetical protein HOP02_02805 [Methylococcaceae bacterium]|nr:hypothetical protein [Methylococcaceae bacterium]